MNRIALFLHLDKIKIEGSLRFAFIAACLVFFLFLPQLALSQAIFNNPSFEGNSANNAAPTPWVICSGTPDILPPGMGGPVVAPTDGNTCLGMVNVIPGIEESVGQLLPDTLFSNTCFSFDIDLRYVPTYLQNCSPGRLRLWLGDSLCHKKTLAYTSPAITHGVWRTYNVSFAATQDYTHASFDLIHLGSTPTNVCMAVDNIRNQQIGVSQLVSIGNDTLLCLGDSLVLDASLPNSTYRWQDNSTDSIFVVKSEGLYWVEVIDVNGCLGRDSIRVDFENALFIGNDTILCPNSSLTLLSNINANSYVWSNNSNNPFIIVDTIGEYWLRITTALGCIQTDTIQIAYEEVLNIGNDTIICKGDSILLSTNLSSTPGITYSWQDNSTGASIFAVDSGWYSVTTTTPFCIQTDSLFLGNIADPNIDIGNDTSLCQGQSLLLDATTTGASSYIWSNSSTSPQINVSTSNLYTVTVTVGACDYVDSVNVVFNTLNPFDLGIDTTICSSDQIVLRAPQSAGFTYRWNDLSTADTLLVNQAGKYWVDVEIGNCKETDTILVSISSFNESLSNLGADSVLCQGQSLTLDATVPGATSYLWSDNSVNPLLLVNTAGIYKVTISDGNCSFVDSIEVRLPLLSPFDLGRDTLLCPNETITLNPPQNPAFSYRWQDNSTSNSFLVNSPGKYWVDVQDGKCIETDTINITYNLFDPNELQLGNDTTICPFDSLTVDATVSWGTSYSWNDNFNLPQRTLKIPNTYIVSVTNGNCIVSDTIRIDRFNFETFSLGADTTLCLNDSLILRSPQRVGYSYIWQNGSSEPEFIVKQAGKYWLTSTFGPCSFTDTIEVFYNSLEAPRPDLGRDTNLCDGIQLLLDPMVSNATSYRWHDGTTGSTFIASGIKDSLYSVEVFNGICSGRDTVLIGGIAKPIISSAQGFVCVNEPLLLKLFPAEGQHTWQDGTIGSEYQVLDSGKYTVLTINQHCTYIDSIELALQDCNCDPIFPNVITPNGDGVNDNLSILQENCDYDFFSLKIYNRYGKVVFETNNPNAGWNGRHLENRVTDGQFFYLLEYDSGDGVKEVHRGSFTLLF